MTPARSDDSGASRRVARAHAIVLAGGRSTRMGRSKALLQRDGEALTAIMIGALLTRIDGQVCVVAPESEPVQAPWGSRVLRAYENPPLGGPVAGIAAGVHALPVDDADVLILAYDLVDPVGVVSALADAPASPDADAVGFLGAGRRPQWLSSRIRRAALDAALAGAPRLRDIAVSRVFDDLRFQALRSARQLARDADDPAAALAAGLELPMTSSQDS